MCFLITSLYDFVSPKVKAIINAIICGAVLFSGISAYSYEDTIVSMFENETTKLINLAREIKTMGVNKMDFTAFDTSKIDKYAAEAKASYEHTTEYREFEEKSKRRTNEETQKINMQMMAIFEEFGTMRELPPESENVQVQVKKLQEFITKNFYACSGEVLYGLGKMYVDDERFTANIDKAGGEGTAGFVFETIKKYCGK